MNNVCNNNSDFCSGCGLCESICPTNAIEIKVLKNFYRPYINNSCISCGKCINNCPNLHYHDVISYNNFKYKLYGHSINSIHRKDAASGGITTELLKYMLDDDLIDYVITANVYQNDYNSEYITINKAHSDNLYNYSGSNYCPTNIGKAIKEVQDNDGRYAVVCLPCLARGIKKLMSEDRLLNNRIKYVISLLCNHLPSYEATDYLIKKYKIKNPKLIKYRGDGWFGSFRTYNQEHTLIKSVSFLGYFPTNFSQCFWQKACIKCIDHFGYDADICVGDADFVKYRNDKPNIGETMIFSNNAQIIEILNKMKESNIIDLKNDITNKELESIYGPLSDQNRGNEKKLKSGVDVIILEEYIRNINSRVKSLFVRILKRINIIKR